MLRYGVNKQTRIYPWRIELNTIKEVMLATVAGLVILGAGAAYAGKNENIDTAINARQAIDIALSSVPGQVYELELEHEDGLTAWEVELVSSEDGKEYELLIDASSGEVIRKEQD